MTGGTVVDCESWLYYATGEADGDVFMAGIAFDTGVPFILKKTSGGVETRWNARATNLFVDASGNVYGTDFLSHQVQIFDNDGMLLTAFGSFGTGPGQFDEPYAVGVRTSDRIYIVDRNNHRVQVFGAGATPAQASSWGRMKAQYR